MWTYGYFYNINVYFPGKWIATSTPTYAKTSFGISDQL